MGAGGFDVSVGFGGTSTSCPVSLFSRSRSSSSLDHEVLDLASAGSKALPDLVKVRTN
jgi:hypothetical protein